MGGSPQIVTPSPGPWLLCLAGPPEATENPELFLTFHFPGHPLWGCPVSPMGTNEITLPEGGFESDTLSPCWGPCPQPLSHLALLPDGPLSPGQSSPDSFCDHRHSLFLPGPVKKETLSAYKPSNGEGARVPGQLCSPPPSG